MRARIRICPQQPLQRSRVRATKLAKLPCIRRTGRLQDTLEAAARVAQGVCNALIWQVFQVSPVGSCSFSSNTYNNPPSRNALNASGEEAEQRNSLNYTPLGPKEQTLKTSRPTSFHWTSEELLERAGRPAA